MTSVAGEPATVRVLRAHARLRDELGVGFAILRSRPPVRDGACATRRHFGQYAYVNALLKLQVQEATDRELVRNGQAILDDYRRLQERAWATALCRGIRP